MWCSSRKWSRRLDRPSHTGCWRPRAIAGGPGRQSAWSERRGPRSGWDEGPRRAVPCGASAHVGRPGCARSEEHTSELQSQSNLVCRLLLEKKKIQQTHQTGRDSARDRPGPYAHLGALPQEDLPVLTRACPFARTPRAATPESSREVRLAIV